MLVLPVAIMKISERTLRISASSFLALLMVSASYLLSGPSFLTRSIANAGSTEELLKEYAEKDTDTDGLPDWQEALYNTDPNNPDSDGDGLSDGEAARAGKLTPQTSASQLPTADDGTPRTTEDILADIPGVDPAPGSITEQFSEEFLQQIVGANGGQPLTEEQQQELIGQLFTQYSTKAAKLFASTYGTISVHTNTSVSLSGYTQVVESVYIQNDVDAEESNPLSLMEALITNNDSSAAPKLLRISKAYAAMAADMRAAQVPPSLAPTHVKSVRALEELSKSTAAISSFQKDPLASLGALTVFNSSSKDFAASITELANVILANGEPLPEQPGALIVKIGRAAE